MKMFDWWCLFLRVSMGRQVGDGAQRSYIKEMEKRMEEIWDIYDGNEGKTGRVMKRGIPQEGDYMLCVHVYLHTPEGKFLMQKRSMSKQSHPGEWDVTGGAVLSGETSIEGAIRETKEEVGIVLTKENLTFVGKIKKNRSFVHIYFAKKHRAIHV